VTVSSLSLPTAFTCHGASLHAAAMLSSLHRGGPTYVSLTRAAGVIRCALHHAESLRDPSTITRRWEQEIRRAWASQTAGASRSDTPRSAGPEQPPVAASGWTR
jgi:hypothetical protein